MHEDDLKRARERLAAIKTRQRALCERAIESSIPLFARYTGRAERQIRELLLGVVPDDLIPANIEDVHDD